MTLCATRIFAGVSMIKILKRDHSECGLVLNEMMSVLIRDRKEDDADTQGRSPCENGERDWSDTPATQGMPRTASSYWTPQ